MIRIIHRERFPDTERGEGGGERGERGEGRGREERGGGKREGEGREKWKKMQGNQRCSSNYFISYPILALDARIMAFMTSSRCCVRNMCCKCEG